MTSRTLTFGSNTYPLILPNIRDPRLHVASVIITIHILGQVGLGFLVSIPADPRGDPDVRRHRDRADLPPDALVRLAGERDADGQWRGPHPAGGRDAAR